MAKSLDLIDERVIAENVLTSVRSVPAIEVPVGPDADMSTVGPGWRVWGVGVHRVADALNIEVELIVTLNKNSSIPSLATRVRQKIRSGIQALTSEEIRWMNLRIIDVRLKD